MLTAEPCIISLTAFVGAAAVASILSVAVTRQCVARNAKGERCRLPPVKGGTVCIRIRGDRPKLELRPGGELLYAMTASIRRRSSS
jgi:hypothetical protein